jgi:hypothetical protein
MLCCSSSLGPSRIKLEAYPLNRNGNPPQRRSDCDRLWCHVGRRSGSTQLQVNVDAISYNTCNQQYGGDIINELMLCAGKTGGGRTVARATRAVQFQCGWRAGWCGELGYWLC